jgi:hypothetical protein
VLTLAAILWTMSKSASYVKSMTKLSLALIFLSAFLYSCSDKPKIDKNLVYSTLNEIILLDSIFAPIVCSRFDKVTISDKIQREFFQNDKSFIEEQLKNSKDLSIDSGKLYFYWKKEKRFEKSFIDATCSKNIFYRLSYPIFSKDLKTVVI